MVHPLRGQRAIELLRVNADWYVGAALTGLGRALRDQGHRDEAREAWREILRILDEYGASDGATFSRSELAQLLAETGPG